MTLKLSPILIDELPQNSEIIELFQGGKLLVDLYNTCVLMQTQLTESQLQLTFVKINDGGLMTTNTVFAVIFKGVQVKSLNIDNDLNDYSTLDGIVLGISDSLEEYTADITIADMILKISYSNVAVEQIEDSVKISKEAFAKYKRITKHR